MKEYRYFKSITTTDRSYDEWINYAGTDKEKALAQTKSDNAHCCDKHYKSETRAYFSTPEENDDFACEYDIID